MQGIRLVTYESPMFLCSRDYLAEFYKGRREEVLPHGILYRAEKTP